MKTNSNAITNKPEIPALSNDVKAELGVETAITEQEYELFEW